MGLPGWVSYNTNVVRHFRQPFNNMWPWKKAKTDDREKEILLKGFPASLAEDVTTVFDIIPLDHNVQYRFGQVVSIDKLIHPDKQIIKLNGEILEIPSRVYFNEPELDKESKLTESQKSILNCIYLRHHNGLVRQKRLDQLMGKDEYFIIPYKFHLLGEYVIEILEDMQQHLTPDSIDSFVKFANDNEKYFVVIESKMVSFWNAHYRWKSQKLRNYIGRQNIDYIKKRTHNI
jgi:hypothetical protein